MLAQAPSVNIYEIMNYIYPVNSIYMTVENITEEQMNSKFGGTWEKIKDRFLLASGDTYSNGSTGGEATHTLTVDEMPSHNHQYQYATSNYWAEQPYLLTQPAVSGNADGTKKVAPENWWSGVASKGGGQAHNNMPPYIVVNVFKRTALYTA